MSTSQGERSIDADGSDVYVGNNKARIGSSGKCDD
jgi:hypothetical protein